MLGPDQINNNAYAELADVINHFKAKDHYDEKCIPLLLGIFGDGDGHGMYQRLDEVLRNYPSDIVISQLVQSISSGSRHVKEWCLELCQYYPNDILKKLLVEYPSSTFLLGKTCYDQSFFHNYDNNTSL